MHPTLWPGRTARIRKAVMIPTRLTIFRTACLVLVAASLLSAARPGIAAQTDPLPAGDESADQSQETEPGAAADNVAPRDSQWSEQTLQSLLDDLSHPDYERRQAALSVVQQVPTAAIPALVKRATAEASAESVRRVFEVLEQIYVSSNTKRAIRAGEVLELACQSDRWMVVELAQGILDRNWRLRVTRSLQELQTLGAAVRPDDLSELWKRAHDAPVAFFGPAMPNDQLRIDLTEDWTGAERGMEVLSRLSPLVENDVRLREVRLGIYLIDGHPLTEEEVTNLKAMFGDRRVVSRGRVCLGITADPFQNDETGCRVGSVAAGSSASDAGLRQGDLIVRLDEVDVKDFDHLVQLLRAYDRGDTVPMSILRAPSVFRRTPRPGIPDLPLQEVQVTLKGWEDFE